MSGARARVLFDINHPAHVHLLRHLLSCLEARGHVCSVAARPKDVTLGLLDHYRIPYVVLAPLGRGRLGRARELLVRELRFYGLARAFAPRLIVGTSVHAARVARLLGARSVVLNEDDRDVVRFFAWLAYPFASAVITPDCLAHERHGSRHLTYPSYQELIYLHPARFRPDASVFGELGLAQGEPYALVRLSALEAHHDAGVRGVSAVLLRRVASLTKDRMRVFVNSEKPLEPEFEPLRLPVPPQRMHDALAFAEFVLGDSQTVTAEAAVLGTPAFRINDFVGRISYLSQLEGYGLAFGFRPGEEDRLVRRLEEVLALPDRRQELTRRRERLLAEKIDPLPWLIETLEAALSP